MKHYAMHVANLYPQMRVQQDKARSRYIKQNHMTQQEALANAKNITIIKKDR